jgi:hypothetical protein
VCVENRLVAEKGSGIIFHDPAFEAELLYKTVFPSVVESKIYTFDPSVVISRTDDTFQEEVSIILQFPVQGSWHTKIPFDELNPQTYPAAEDDDFTSVPGTFVHCKDDDSCVETSVLIPSVAVSYSF